MGRRAVMQPPARGRRRAASRAPVQQPGAGGVADGGERRPRRPVVGGRAERGDVRRELRQHLAVQGAVEQRRREQRGARAEASRTAAIGVGVGTPAARCTASQPQSTSSPSGVSPSPRPTRSLGVRGDAGGRGCRARWPRLRARVRRDCTAEAELRVQSRDSCRDEPADPHRPRPRPARARRRRSWRRVDRAERHGEPATAQRAGHARRPRPATTPRHRPSRSRYTACAAAVHHRQRAVGGRSQQGPRRGAGGACTARGCPGRHAPRR